MDVRANSPTHAIPALSERDGLAYRDDLTGLHNRRLLSELLREGWADLLDRHRTVTLILFDLDLFKEVNDTWGHMAGDEALRTASQQLRRHLRETDLLIRYGGDEFVAVLPGAEAADAVGLIERAREVLQANRFRPSEATEPVDLPISFSHGVAVAPRDGETGEEVLRRADERLYDDKRRRRQLLEPTAASRGPRWWLVAVAVAPLLLLGGLSWLWLGPAPGLPNVPTEAVDQEAVTLSAAGVAPANVDGLLRQIEELQGQVNTLNQALKAERSQASRDQYQQELRSLGGTIADLQSQLIAVDPTTAVALDSGTADTGSLKPAVEASANSRPTAADEVSPAPVPAGPPQIRLPTLASPLRLSYPYPARQMRREATIDLLLMVEADGTVSSAEPIGTRVGFGFEEAAQQAALRARFTAGSRDGTAQRMPTRLSVRFELSSP